VHVSTLLYQRRRQIAAFAMAHGLPTTRSPMSWVRDGLLMSYGPTLRSYFGAPVITSTACSVVQGRELPVEQSTKFKLVINLRTAKGPRPLPSRYRSRPVRRGDRMRRRSSSLVSCCCRFVGSAGAAGEQGLPHRLPLIRSSGGELSEASSDPSVAQGWRGVSWKSASAGLCRRAESRR